MLHLSSDGAGVDALMQRGLGIRAQETSAFVIQPIE